MFAKQFNKSSVFKQNMKTDNAFRDLIIKTYANHRGILKYEN